MDIYEVVAAACALAGAAFMFSKAVKAKKMSKFFAKAKAVLETAKSFFSKDKDKENK